MAEKKEHIHFGNEMATLIYDHQDSPDYVAKIFEQSFSYALDFAFEHSRFDRIPDRELFKRQVMQSLCYKIREVLKCSEYKGDK